MRELIYLSTAKLNAFQQRRRPRRVRPSAGVKVSLFGIDAHVTFETAGDDPDSTYAVLQNVEKALRKTAVQVPREIPKPGQWFRFDTQAVWTGHRDGWPWIALPLNLVLFGLHHPSTVYDTKSTALTVLLCGSADHLQPRSIDEVGRERAFHVPPYDGVPQEVNIPSAVLEPPNHVDAATPADRAVMPEGLPTASAPVGNLPVSSHEWLSATLPMLSDGPEHPDPAAISAREWDVRRYQFLVRERERSFNGDSSLPVETDSELVAVPAPMRSDLAMLRATRALHADLLGRMGPGAAPHVSGYARALVVGQDRGEPPVVLATPLVIEYAS